MQDLSSPDYMSIEAFGASADGSVIVGKAHGVESFNHAFRWVGDSCPCDGVDFNNDGNFIDPQDIDAFLSVYSEGPCVPASATTLTSTMTLRCLILVI